MEAVSEVVAWVHGGFHFAAVRAEEHEPPVAEFGRRPITTEGSDGGLHTKKDRVASWNAAMGQSA